LYFSPLVKQEAARIIPSQISEQKSELLAFIIINGELDFKNEQLVIILDNPVMIKVVYFLIKKAFQYEAQINIIQKTNKKKIYYVIIANSQKTRCILEQFGLTDNLQIKSIRKGKVSCKDISLSRNFSNQAFLRGAFLGGGFVNDPERMYHLEIACPSKEVAILVRAILQNSSFPTKISFWQREWTVYIKKSEQIFEFLRFIGIQRALLNLQDIIARKDILNTVNRLVNCESANLDRTILSASRQLFYIDLLKRNIGLDNLSPNLIEVIKVREEYPYASIQELANALEGHISKSGIFHRLKKIEQLAKYYLPENNVLKKN
jgi:hypothetical protein